MIMKECVMCKIEKDECEFSFRRDSNSYRKACKDCLLKQKKIYYQKNKEEIKKKRRQYRIDNRENVLKSNKKYYENNRNMVLVKSRENHKRYYLKNKSKFVIKNRQYMSNIRKNNICFRIRENISRNINYYLHQNNSSKQGSSILQHLPYTIQQLKDHLEFQFEPWMNWENYGKYEEGKQKWNIDHIIPQSKLPYDSMEHENFQKCWALENLRPLEIMENIKKGNRLI